ncbi:putative sporulation protein YyaC [Caldanaerobius fijiensis DSM 17918]|uniref:Putative sporulation protein YyaC n=1 Tax=Caldanaerobius fijiensis DSM 17918 TaxID=1121256 RepID=A0A1M4WLJ4_9THEO|nr:putative sporulation protein YyaC [Caldanaerobius fijiensis DSM 17918]
MAFLPGRIDERINYTHPNAINFLTNILCNLIAHDDVFLCIGTDKYIGDALGPIVGNNLIKMHPDLKVYGTLKEPVHAINIVKTMHMVKKKHPTSRIVAIDACLGEPSSIGDICIKNQPLFPGKGVGKNLPPVGDISIIGIIDVYEMYSLRNTRLSLIMDMADIISLSISMSLHSLQYRQYR